MGGDATGRRPCGRSPVRRAAAPARRRPERAADRRRVQARRRGGCAGGGGAARLAQDGDGRLIAAAGRALDVVRALQRAGAALPQRRRGSARARPAASRRARRHRPPSARAGGESGTGAARRCGGRGRWRSELVERLQRHRLARRRRRPRPARARTDRRRSPRPPGPGEHRRRAARSRSRTPPRPRAGSRRRTVASPARSPIRRRAGELLQVERVAAGRRVDVSARVADQLAGLVRAQLAHLDAVDAFERAGEPLRHLARADREREQRPVAVGGRRSSEPSSSSEPESAQCRSSRISTSGFGPASSSSSARTARCRR